MTTNHSTRLLRLRWNECGDGRSARGGNPAFQRMSYRRNRAWRTEKRAGVDPAATANLYVEKAPVPASRFTGISALRSRTLDGGMKSENHLSCEPKTGTGKNSVTRCLTPAPHD